MAGRIDLVAEWAPVGLDAALPTLRALAPEDRGHRTVAMPMRVALSVKDYGDDKDRRRRRRAQFQPEPFDRDRSDRPGCWGALVWLASLICLLLYSLSRAR